MIKRVLFFFCAVVCFFAIEGCKEKKIYKIGVSQCSADDWRMKMNNEIAREAMLHDDVEVEILSADDNSEKQIKDLKYFVDNHFDIIIVAPNEAEALTPIIKEIHEKGIPVIVFDRNINGEYYTSRIGVDNVGMGEAAAQYAPTLVGNPVRALEIFGLPGSTPAEERHIGFMKGLQEMGGELLGGAPANWNQAPAEKVADSLLRLYPQTNLIFAHNDRMALGAYEVLERMGRRDIKIIGIDAAPTIGIQGVADGKIDATFLYPTEGHLILRQAFDIINGKPFEREVYMPLSSAVDSSNADILLLQNSALEEDTKKVEILKGQLNDYWEKHTNQTTLLIASIVIVVLLFGLLFMTLRTFWQHRRHQEALMMKNSLLEEERDKQKELNRRLEEATNSKLVFFTNVSHDLRTPLTLIAEPVSQIKDASNLTAEQKALMKIADKNVRILHRLINQILDFRKFENDKLRLNLTEVDFDAVIKDWMEAFYPVATKRHISLTLNKGKIEEGATANLALDTEKIERVFFNLISNALKYSPDNSVITVDWEIAGEKLTLKVADTGEGISREDIGHIFDRFYRVDEVRPKGSGIGLSLAKAFVELHGGEMSVESELGKGSTFTVTIPVTHVSEQTTAVTPNITIDEVETELGDIDVNPEFSDDKPVMLVIDDNRDIRDLLTEILKDDYNVITASGGTEGIKKAVKFVPDIIVCDVMMPGIDGMETCKRLKSEMTTSHIPVLMLTACTADEQRVQGFDSGADGYIAKPFSSDVLKSQARSLIANRKLIKDVLGLPSSSVKRNTIEKKPGATGNKDIDNEFYNKFLTLFEEMMSDSSLSVDSLASKMGFERTQFYRKIKALTNFSPVELMRDLRLKRARTLLTSSDKTVSEICYAVGFSTPAYFTKCYREMYRETPTETRASLSS